MGLAAIIGFFCCVIGFPAILGVWLVRLWHGKLEEDADIANPTGIAVGLAVVIAASILAAVSQDAQREIGPWFAYLGAFNAVAFCLGLGIGLIEHRQR